VSTIGTHLEGMIGDMMIGLGTMIEGAGIGMKGMIGVIGMMTGIDTVTTDQGGMKTLTVDVQGGTTKG